ncbi:MAG: PH domain-containing protein [Candidatus Eremiobacterota bacterium]
MSELIQKISASLVKKFKEIANADEKIHFCIEGVKGNALIGTNKKVYSITSGSFKGTLCYSYVYDNIIDIKVIPPLHGDNITLSIIPQKYDDKELKQRLYFQPEQNNLLKQILAKISSLSKTYTYIEPMKEISLHQSSTEFIVPMKNVLGKVYEKNIKSSEKVIICISIGDHQGLVCTNERLLIFKITEDKTSKTGVFPLEEILDIEYSIGLVTGYLQIITPKVNVIKKKLREQELMNIDNIISFGKKNYGELMEEVSKRLEVLIKNAKRKKDTSIEIKNISKEKEEKRKENRKNMVEKEIDEMEVEDMELPCQNVDEIVSDMSQEDMLPLDELSQKLSEEIIEEIKSDEQSFYYSRDIVKQISLEVVKHSFPELISGKLPDTITELVMKYLAQRNLKNVPANDNLLEEYDELNDFDNIEIAALDFDEFSVEAEAPDTSPVKAAPPAAGKIKSEYSREEKGKTSVKAVQSFQAGTDKVKTVSSLKSTGSKEIKSKGKFSPPKISVVEKKLANFTSLKNISAALLVDGKSGSIICKSAVEAADYDKSSGIAIDIIKFIKSSRQAVRGNFIPQWKTEYEHGIVYIEEINLNYLLMIVGTEKSNFATLKMFIEKHKEELKKELL